MPLPSRTIACLLTGLVLVAALAGGLWWNAKRLNETERQLVGVWEGINASGERSAFALLPDRTEADFLMVNGKWRTAYREWRWSATPWSFSVRQRWALEETWQEWHAQATNAWYGKNRNELSLDQLPDGELVLGSPGWKSWTLRRSTDPELLGAFDRLSGGDSP